MIPNKNIQDFIIKEAEPKDIGLMLQFIKELAEYENMLDDITASEELLEINLFKR